MNTQGCAGEGGTGAAGDPPSGPRGRASLGAGRVQGPPSPSRARRWQAAAGTAGSGPEPVMDGAQPVAVRADVSAGLLRRQADLSLAAMGL